MADEAIERFVERWRRNEGGAERANFPLFLTELCRLLDLPSPDPADATHEHNDYVFERAVSSNDPDGIVRHGRIDLYRRGSFVLEAKQSRERGGAKQVALAAQQVSLPGMEPPRGRRSADAGWDVLMRNVRLQAEKYARALPESHGWPPFILTVDVGHAIEIFADFSGQGKNYRQFPDRRGFRIYLDDLHEPAVRGRLRAVWLDPRSLDPATRAARVTRDIAQRLASVGKLLEDRGHPAEPVAHFLMRCLFTMFAQDTRLLEPGSFTRLLAEARDDPDSFAPMLEGLWADMDAGGFSHVLRRRVRHFNGGLFADPAAIVLRREEIGELYEAARHDWTEVEPAIFGTLLEQALDPVERRRLGAHYTPRAYVERLVIATVVEPLQREWEGAVLGAVERERGSDRRAAIRTVHEFHEKLATTRVLDPACGTGNFLYVALELLKRLEGDVLEVLADLGGQEALQLETATVHPRNFLGLELNPRAAAIAELVLWLGYLQWQLRNGGTVADPVLEKLSNITAMDAVLSPGPVARKPDWPEADYIVGNPPFIGGKDLRGRLGEPYATALWRAHPKINRSADFVMYWWDRAAGRLTERGTRLKRFGFVTTNSITQEFSRRVIARRLDAPAAIRLVMAVPDHPWTKATRDAAAVRIAMTVVEAGSADGTLLTVTAEADLDTDAPVLTIGESEGRIHADLSIGTDAGQARALRANNWLCSRGVSLHGAGFIVPAATARRLVPDAAGRARVIRPYLNGRDLTGRTRGVSVIDLSGLDQVTVRRSYPGLYQHLLTTVKPARQRQYAGNPTKDAAFYLERWWEFGKPRPELRAALHGLHRYIATVETAKHRVFSFVDAAVLPDNMLVCIASDAAHVLGIVGSRIALAWTYANSGLIGVARFEQGHRYTKSNIFDPLPFPDATPAQHREIAEWAEELDVQRKAALADHDDLTLTILYNLRAAVRAGRDLSPIDEDRRRRGRVDIIAELHDRIDAAVAEAYGWPADLDDAAIVARLVALNAARRTEEQAGIVRWLRPDYQIARAGLTALPVTRPQGEQIAAPLVTAVAGKPVFPRDAIGQTAAVLADLRSDGALDVEAISRRYAQGRRVDGRVRATLDALIRLGHVSVEGGRYRLRRVA